MLLRLSAFLFALSLNAGARHTVVDDSDPALNFMGADSNLKELLIGFSVPEPDNLADENEMKCSACHTTLQGFLTVFNNLRKKARKDDDMSWVKEYHLLERTEGICENMRADIGLLGSKLDKELSTRISDAFVAPQSEDTFKIAGAWVAKFWDLNCARFADRFDQVIMSLFRRESDVKVCPECKDVKIPGLGVVLKKSKKNIKKPNADEL